MIYILAIGLGLAVLGLNIMIVWKMLTTTSADTTEEATKLILRGVLVTICGFLVAMIGVWRLGIVAAEGGVILAAGAQVAILGLAWILGVIARGRERCVRDGAWFVTGVGLGFILAYLIVVYLIPLF